MEDDIKRILQDKQVHLQLKSEQKEIIQNVLERKDSMAVFIRNPYMNRFTNHFSIHS
jgi:glutamine amidotransferase PdxT